MCPKYTVYPCPQDEICQGPRSPHSLPRSIPAPLQHGAQAACPALRNSSPWVLTLPLPPVPRTKVWAGTWQIQLILS